VRLDETFQMAVVLRDSWRGRFNPRITRVQKPERRPAGDTPPALPLDGSCGCFSVAGMGLYVGAQTTAT
jgi:hypothetical protein